MVIECLEKLVRTRLQKPSNIIRRLRLRAIIWPAKLLDRDELAVIWVAALVVGLRKIVASLSF